ncbi:MAG TPA: signal peptidase I [Bryobacteraceae bacterium]|nr:signal peptidase I [Bryobacteraceae bacterium]
MATTPTTRKDRKQGAAEKPATQKAGAVPRNSIAEWTLTILILLFGTSTIAQPFVIPTSSMHNTLYTGDHLIVDKLAYSPPGSLSRHLLPYEDVKRGDIIVFRHPTLISVDYVKRVIGLPGDHIKLVNKQVFLNGKPLNEPYVIHMDNSLYYRDNFPQGEPDYVPDLQQLARAKQMLRDNVVNGELVVPPAYYFAMGDNRDNSLDSRYWGLVPRDNITGKPLIVFWSYDAPTEDLKDYSVHHFIDLGLHFFTKTRWDRTLKLIHGYPLG